MRYSILLIASVLFMGATAQSPLLDAKAYKEAKKITTLNVNKIMERYEDGSTLVYNQAYLGRKTVVVKKRNTGRKDYEGNVIYHVVLTDVKSNDSVVMYPRYEYFPNEFECLSYIHSGVSYPIRPSEIYKVYDTQKKGFMSSKTSSYTESGYLNLGLTIGTKVRYDRQDLLDDLQKKRYLGYQKHLSELLEYHNASSYEDQIKSFFNREYVAVGLGGDNYAMLKVKKTESGYTLIKPFADGQYPDKEEFHIYVKKEENGFYRIQNEKEVRVKPDPNMSGNGYGKTLNDDYLVPVGNGIVPVRLSDLKLGAKNISIPDFTLAKHPIDLSSLRHDLMYSSSKEFEMNYKLTNQTEQMDDYNPELFGCFIAQKLLPIYFAGVKK